MLKKLIFTKTSWAQEDRRKHHGKNPQTNKTPTTKTTTPMTQRQEQVWAEDRRMRSFDRPVGRKPPRQRHQTNTSLAPTRA